MSLTDDDLDGHSVQLRYPDDTFVRIMIRRTSDAAYPSGWHYALHYGAVDPDAVDVPAEGRAHPVLRQRPRGHERPRTSTSRPIQIPRSSSSSEW